MDVKDKVVVVTGSSSGIGRATALLFAQAGAKVVVNSQLSVSQGKETVSEIEAVGGHAIYVQADVSEPTDVEMLFHTALDTFGTVDVLVNNAGRTIGQPFRETTKEHWLAVLSINLVSAVICSKAAAAIMLDKGRGKIINVSSIRGLEHGGREGIMAYSAAKAALINFTKTLAKELAPHVNVNAIAPGFVHTPPYNNFSEEQKESFTKITAIKRFIEEDEIAETILHLAKNDAITGALFTVDGGFSLKFG